MEVSCQLKTESEVGEQNGLRTAQRAPPSPRNRCGRSAVERAAEHPEAASEGSTRHFDRALRTPGQGTSPRPPGADRARRARPMRLRQTTRRYREIEKRREQARP